MTAIYSTRFVLIATAGTGEQGDYTVPVGYVAIVRSIDFFATSAAPVDIIATIGPTPIGFVRTQFPAYPNSVSWSGRQVANAGEKIGVYVVSGAGHVTISGYLLSL